MNSIGMYVCSSIKWVYTDISIPGEHRLELIRDRLVRQVLDQQGRRTPLLGFTLAMGRLQGGQVDPVISEELPVLGHHLKVTSNMGETRKVS